MQPFATRRLLTGLALSITLSASQVLAEIPANSINDGQIIKGGTYTNTPDGVTTFLNSKGTGLWLQSGNTIRGLETTGNGGNVHLFAPNQVVRVDGNINVNSNDNTKDGGKVFIDAAYLFQNGIISANGMNGGLVQVNVVGMTLGSTGQILAKGEGGQGGVVAVNASGPVETQQGALIDSRGKVSGTIDTNVINIEGSLLNLRGNLIADGVNSRGGTIRLVSTGQTDIGQVQSILNKSAEQGVLTQTEASTLNTHLHDLQYIMMDGDIRIGYPPDQPGNTRTILSASGTGVVTPLGTNDPTDPTPRAGDGGTIIITSAHNFTNNGWILANGAQGSSSHPESAPDTNGGNGGTVSIDSWTDILNNGRIVADGGNAGISKLPFVSPLKGGDGGLIALSTFLFHQNNGVIRTMGGNASSLTGGTGGHGGLIVFSGGNNTYNPEGTGVVVAYGGSPGIPGMTSGKMGTIVAANSQTTTLPLLGSWQKSSPLELLSHAENILLLRNGIPTANMLDENLSTWSYNAHIRSVLDPVGQAPQQHGGLAESEFFNKLAPINQDTEHGYYYRNLVLANGTGYPLRFDPVELNRGIDSNITSQGIPPLSYNTMTILSPGNLSISPKLFSGDTLIFGHGMGGGRFSSISNFVDANFLGLVGGQAGGSVNIAAESNINLYSVIAKGGLLHGGSLILKAQNMINLYNSVLLTNGNLMGGTLQLIGWNGISGDSARLYAQGGLSGGIVSVRSPGPMWGFSTDTSRVAQSTAANYIAGQDIRDSSPLEQPWAWLGVPPMTW